MKFSRRMKFGLLVLLASALGATYLVANGARDVRNFVNDFVNHGTIFGLEQCAKINGSPSISDESVGLSCIPRIDSPVDYETFAARGRVDGRSPFEMWLNIDNHSTENFLTRLVVHVEYLDDGRVSSSLEETVFLSIEPKDRASETVVFRGDAEKFEGADFCNSSLRDGCFTWWVEPFGLTVR